MDRRRGFRWAAPLLAGLLVAGACSVEDGSGSASSETTNGTDTSEQAPPNDEELAPAVDVQGISDDTIKLGFAPIDAKALREQFGVELGETPEGAIEALVASVNDNGGINGRQIEVALRPFLPVGTESSDSACRELIEDEQVYAVLGLFLGDGGLCVTETYGLPYFSLFGLDEGRQERSEAPFIVMEGDNLNATVEAILETGAFEGRKVAVYMEGDQDPDIVTRRIIEPLEEGGIEIVSEAQLPSSGDAVQAASDIDLIFSRFQSDGADGLLVLSGAAVVLPALERTQWAPQLVVTNGQFTSDGGLDGFGLSDLSEMEGALAITGTLLSDDIANDEAFLDCLAIINEHTGSDYTADDIYPEEMRPESRGIGQVPGLCQLWDLTVTVLEAAGDQLEPDALRAALDRVGDFSLPGFPEASLSSQRWGAVDAVRVWHFDLESGAFVPQSA